MKPFIAMFLALFFSFNLSANPTIKTDSLSGLGYVTTIITLPTTSSRYLNIRFFQGHRNQIREYELDICSAGCSWSGRNTLVVKDEFEVINLDTSESKIIRLVFYKFEKGNKVVDFMITLDPKDKFNSKISFCKIPPVKLTDACESEELAVKTENLFGDMISTFFLDKDSDEKISRGLRANVYKIRDRPQFYSW